MRAEAETLLEEKKGVVAELCAIKVSFKELEDATASAQQQHNSREQETRQELKAAQNDSKKLRSELEQAQAAFSSTSSAARGLEEQLVSLQGDLDHAQKRAAEDAEQGAALAGQVAEAEKKASMAKDLLTKVRDAS